MVLPELNLGAIIVATLIEVIVGAMWFNAPFAFNRQWLAGIGKTADEVAEDASSMSIVVAVVGALLTAIILALFIKWFGINSGQDGLLIGILVAVGFSANTAFVKDRFEGRPLNLSLVNASHDVVILGLMGLILGLWQ